MSSAWVGPRLTQVRRGARPWPGCGVFYQPGTYRVQLGIAQSLPQVGWIEWAGVKASLPQVSGGAVSCVPVRSVAAVGVLEGLGQSIGCEWNQHEMNVIGHQAVAEQGYVGALDVLSQQFEVDVTVHIAVEDESACVAALGNMMGTFSDDHPGQACHQEPLVKRSCCCCDSPLRLLCSLIQLRFS